ncbi:hypothetical protein LTR78_009501 [Recurvomyces mirabilis]|uniref:C3H1-type domain-containing protein n=1 Tax=Recurvomyces mirabilis TaxID=574656 RepID=A0AAE0TTJ2_9PEZI|nr:hypothetical protein LTR78_009501 [Recurvomyces mirabilis]KAK5152405.1 hypothetical protein LTS14_008352 [Recurvomyces mirabilis]
MPMAVAGPSRPYNGMPGDVAAFGPLAMPRSPPKNKSESAAYTQPVLGERRLRRSADTQHVPCKFFLQGNCQAGHSCPFSHDLESTMRPVPCKYFQKGACKFGRKCALLHITPNGTVVNRMPPAQYIPTPTHPGAPGQIQQGPFAQVPPGLLAQGFDRDGAQEYEQYQYSGWHGYDAPIDMTLTSASPQYGSPLQNDGFATSPPQRGLSVLDAPLPNSFDSNGISMAARNGPFASSVPSRFGIDSPPASYPRKSQFGNTALRDLHSSAFGDRGIDGHLAGLGSSPPSGPDEPLTFAKRPLHSDILRSSARQPMMSASLGTKHFMTPFEQSDDEDDGGEAREDLLPAALVRDLKEDDSSLDGSRRRKEDETPAGFLSAARRTLSSQGTPQDSRVGSLGSSPSRYSSMFAKPSSGASETNGLGHVGSPLRNTGLANPTGSKANVSPPQQSSMSVLTQEFQRAKLDPTRPEAQVNGGAMRSLSNGSTVRGSLDRGLSNTSVSKIDEEQDLFDMEGFGDLTRNVQKPVPNGEMSYGAIGAHRATK